MIRYDPPDLWDARARATVELAAQVVGTALMPYTGLGARESFEAVFGDIHVRFTKTLKYYAHSSGDVIRFRHPDFVGIALTVHELGHTFDRRAKLAPQKKVVWQPTLGGSLWPGMHPPTLAGYTPAEEWANLFADWCMGMLAQNAVGKRLEKFMTDGMPAWCALAMGVTEVKA